MDEFLNQIWKINRLYISNESSLNTDSKIAAIILSVDIENHDRFSNLQTFSDIMKSLNLQNSLFGIQTAQLGIINSIKNLKISRLETLNNVKTLNKENIINDDKYDQIYKFLNQLELVAQDFDSDLVKSNLAFYKNIEELNLVANELSKFDEKAKIAFQKANDNEFVISITGVINAGKSSMLNALLQSEVLGTSNIPETANLSLLKYSKNDNAKVVFYNEDEMSEFGIKERFKDKFIQIDEIKDYTSAQFEISKFVKMVEIGLNLPFLKDNITIVDTPGLDDSVVLREKLTKHFMDKSDAIIHLMNAAQASTKKDINFIIDTLKNSKNSSLIVVLTHADLLSDEELIDSISYTQKSIKEELKALEFGENLLNEVRFFAIDSISKTGIVELKTFIYDMFFGANSKKANLIIFNYKKELNFIVSKLIEEGKFEIANLSKDYVELEKENELFNSQIKDLKENMAEITSEVDEYLKKLNYDDMKFDISFKTAFLKVKDRIVSDLKYSQNKNKKIDLDRIKIIFESGLKDCIIDVLREISLQISKDIELIKSNLKDKFDFKNDFEINIRQFFEKNLAFDEQNLTSKVIEISKNSTNLEQKSNIFDELFNDFLKNFNLKDVVKNLVDYCTFNFKEDLSKNLEQMKNELIQKQNQLQNISLDKKENSQKNVEKLETLKKNLEILQAIQKRLNSVK